MNFSHIVPPRWIIEPKDVEVVQGNSARVDCQADGFPKPIIRWKQLTGKFVVEVI